MVWWDVRAHPRLGTVEVREMDVQASLEDAAALAALVHALARAGARGAARRRPAVRGDRRVELPREPRRRGGADPARRGLRPLREVARATVASVAGHARELGSADALEGIERIVREGGGAARRRAAAQRGGMEEMLAQLVADTEAVPWQS